MFSNRLRGQPPKSLLALVPEAANYDLFYQLDIPAGAAWGNAPIPCQVNNVTHVTDAFTRVAYYMELVNADTTTNWVYVSMDRFTTNASSVPRRYP